MTAAPLPTEPADRAAQHADVLDDFVALGHRLARLVVDQAEAKILPAPEATIAFERVARSVRRCILLVRKLAEPVKTADRTAARKQIIRTVEDNIQRHTDGADAEILHRELLDRLDAPDLEDEIGNRPIKDIITDIIRDLGLAAMPDNHPWKRRTPADIAELCARAAQSVLPIHTPGVVPWPRALHPALPGYDSA